MLKVKICIFVCDQIFSVPSKSAAFKLDVSIFALVASHFGKSLNTPFIILWENLTCCDHDGSHIYLSVSSSSLKILLNC